MLQGHQDPKVVTYSIPMIEESLICAYYLGNSGFQGKKGERGGSGERGLEGLQGLPG